MKLIKHEGIFEQITEQEYTPTPLELHYWYSGTNAGLDPNNPYAPKKSMKVTKTIYRRVKN